MAESILNRLESTGKLPTPPGVVMKLLELTERENISAGEIADTIAMDPGLTAKILRFANSPLAGIPREVTSLQLAISLMGVRGVKMTALSFSVLSMPGLDECVGFNANQFSLQSVCCGVAAKILATHIGSKCAQEALVAGLLSQIGRAVLAGGFKDEYAEVLANARQVPLDLPDLERSRFDDTYATVGAEVLKSWRLPDHLCNAIGRFRSQETLADAPDLVRILSVAETAASVICSGNDADPLAPDCFIQSAHAVLGIETTKAQELLPQIAEEAERMRSSIDIPAGKMKTPELLQNEVRERIAELSLALHMENQSMAVQQEDLMRRATTDSLTGIGNRAAFDARLTLELERCIRDGSSLGMMMIDVDRFKLFNDTHGHQAGDLVLQSVAQALDGNIRKVDYVARYGGEEFAVITPNTSQEGLVQLAQRLRRAVEEVETRGGEQHLSVTISIGVHIIGDVMDASEAVALIKCADTQLYKAKEAGRNRVCATFDCPMLATPRC